jgi:hypothetical protein
VSGGDLAHALDHARARPRDQVVVQGVHPPRLDRGQRRAPGPLAESPEVADGGDGAEVDLRLVGDELLDRVADVAILLDDVDASGLDEQVVQQRSRTGGEQRVPADLDERLHGLGAGQLGRDGGQVLLHPRDDRVALHRRARDLGDHSDSGVHALQRLRIDHDHLRADSLELRDHVGLDAPGDQDEVGPGGSDRLEVGSGEITDLGDVRDLRGVVVPGSDPDDPVKDPERVHDLRVGGRQRHDPLGQRFDRDGA